MDRRTLKALQRDGVWWVIAAYLGMAAVAIALWFVATS
jgi:hypothetical protein